MDVYSIGEMVIDFIPGNEKDSYIRNAGGAPANVTIAVSRNGLDAGFCGMLGDDDFGKFLKQTLEENNVEILCKELTKKAITTMAFVSLKEDGERSFTFARKPGADMFLTEDHILADDLEKSKIIHAGSCSLSKDPASKATIKALRLAHEMNKIVSFDINYRNLMWDDNINAATKKILEIMPYVDILKISEEEVGIIDTEKNLHEFMKKYGLTLIIETLGSNGAKCYFSDDEIYSDPIKTKAVDATGAGDAFWGGFLSKLIFQNISKSSEIRKEHVIEAMKYGNVAGYICVQSKGAIDSLPNREQIESYLNH